MISWHRDWWLIDSFRRPKELKISGVESDEWMLNGESVSSCLEKHTTNGCLSLGYIEWRNRIEGIESIFDSMKFRLLPSPCESSKNRFALLADELSENFVWQIINDPMNYQSKRHVTSFNSLALTVQYSSTVANEIISDMTMYYLQWPLYALLLVTLLCACDTVLVVNN